MSIQYLDALDALLQTGLDGLGSGFRDAQVQFILARQHPEGGFPGRLGGPDLYYTDFAVRSLSLLAPEHPALAAVAGFLAGAPQPRTTVECFNALNLWRMLDQQRIPAPVDHPAVADALMEHLLPGGGLGRQGALSAYDTFLGSLSLQILRMQMPGAAAAVEAVRGLRCGDGGFAERPGQSAGQTNATAAAVAVLTMSEALNEEELAGARAFLLAQQMPEGGLRAHADAGAADLLSTFTGMLTLWGLEALGDLDLPAAGRFLKSVAQRGGGFLACAGDDQADLEYLYYGLGAAALLRAHAIQEQG